MSKKRETPAKETPAKKVRIQVVATREQADILSEAAAKAGMADDRSGYILAHAMSATRQDSAKGPMLIVDARAADVLRGEAQRQGIDVSALLRQIVTSMRQDARKS